MHIGIDFDNTIVCYDALFHKVASEWQLIPDDLPQTKLAVRDYLRAVKLENRWTEMQGYVYGARMDEARAYDGVIEFFQRMIDARHQISIISHKTRYPFLGAKFDLHAAAQSWIDNHLLTELTITAYSLAAHFELTKQAKLARISACGCHIFIDDLPEILLDPEFPVAVRALLFDPERHHQDNFDGLDHFASWEQLSRRLIGR